MRQTHTWTKADDDQLQALVREAQAMGRGWRWVSRQTRHKSTPVSCCKRWYAIKGNIPDGESITLPNHPVSELTRYQTTILDEPRLERERTNVTDKILGKTNRNLLLADPHSPLIHQEACEKAIEMGKREGCNGAIVIGDLFDAYSVSRFPKTAFIELRKELLFGIRLLEQLAKVFDYVVVTGCNHHRRILRLLQNRLAGHEEIVEMLRPYTDPYLYGQKTTGRALPKNLYTLESWWFKLGDTIFGHPDWYTKIPSKTVQNSYTYFTIKGEDFNALFQGHTHHLAGPFPYRRKWLCEVPATCIRPDYMDDGRKWDCEHHIGYGIATIVKGQFQPNESRCFWYGWV